MMNIVFNGIELRITIKNEGILVKFAGVILHIRDINNPPRTVDLTPLIFFRSGCLMNKVHMDKPTETPLLKNSIREKLMKLIW